MIGKRNLRYGSVSLVITVTVIVFIILANAVLTFLFKRYPLNIDLTENRVFEISAGTREYLASLNQDVTIYVMNTEAGFVSTFPNDYFVQANEVIRKYSQHSSRIRLEYIDLMRNPVFSSRYPQEQIQINDVIVDSGGKYRVIYPTALFNIISTEYGGIVASSRAEQAMTSALINVTSDKEYLAAVITGHGEQDIYSFLELLILNNYEITGINLLTGDIPPETSILILADPSRDLSPEELRKIDTFLETGDNRVFFYVASVLQPELPNLDIFLAEWGIAVEPGIVFETDNNRLISPSQFVALVDYAEDTYSKNMIQRNLQPLIPQARPLRVVYEEFRYRYVTTLLKFSPASGIRPSNAPSDWTPSFFHLTGNTPALLLSTQSRQDANRNLFQTHVLVLGSILALEESTLGNPYIANSEYFLDLLGSLTDRKDSINILDKIVGFAELRANYSQVITLTIFFAGLLPLAVLTAGIVVWLRRRHK